MRRGGLGRPPSFAPSKSKSPGQHASHWAEDALGTDTHRHSPPLFVFLSFCRFVSSYDSFMEAVDSDHKPVGCLLECQVAITQEAKQRRLYGRLLTTVPELKAVQLAAATLPPTAVSAQSVLLEGRQSCVVKLANLSDGDVAVFEVCSEGVGRKKGEEVEEGNPKSGAWREGAAPGGSLPSWLQVTPGSGVVGPRQSVSLEMSFFE